MSTILQDKWNDGSGSATTITISPNSSFTAGSGLRISVTWGDTTATPTCSDGTNTYSSARAISRDTVNGQSCCEFHAGNIASGSPTITVNFGASYAFRGIRLEEVSGVATAPYDASNGQYQAAPSGTDSISSLTVSNTVQPGILLATSVNTDAAGTTSPSAGTGFSNPPTATGWGFGGTALARAEYKAITTTAGTAATFTPATGGQHHITTAAIFDDAAVSTASYGIKLLKTPPGRKPGKQPPAYLFEAGQPNSYILTAQAGSYVYTGVSAILLRSKLITASAGSYTYTGVSAVLLKSKVIVASAGAYVYSGQSAILLKSKVLVASAGSYVYAGQSATLLKSNLIVASPGAYNYTGVSAVLTYTPAGSTYTLTAQPGSYTYSGIDAILLKSKVIVADPGSYTYTGESATVSWSGEAVPAGSGSTGGGGAIYYPKRKRKERHISELVDDVAAMYAELKADPKTKTEAAQIVKPYAEDKKAVPVRVDWQALEQDAARVSQLIALWQRREAQEREDEEWFMLH